MQEQINLSQTVVWLVLSRLCFHRADSVTWNAHKLMGALLQCSALLLRDEVGHVIAQTQIIAFNLASLLHCRRHICRVVHL